MYTHAINAQPRRQTTKLKFRKQNKLLLPLESRDCLLYTYQIKSGHILS
uniref:Uncharacterized protein n=1 Tax=Tetranychus urticae TaxID=32264 RepID=T1K531_TETUR